MQETLFTHLASPASSDSNIGELRGLSISFQPNMSVCGWPTTAGSRALEGFTAVYDATAVERLKQAGANVKGSIRMSELGFGLAGDTGAEILSSGRADCVLMTDTMGEARVSACLADAFGFKPSYGLVSRFGLIGLVPSMECY